MAIQFYGPISSWNALADISRQVAHWLTASYSHVSVWNYHDFDASWSCWENKSWGRKRMPRRQELSGLDGLSVRRNPDAPIGIFHGTPEIAAGYLEPHKVKIGLFACEATRIPQEWVRVCNFLDLVVVPSSWCKKVFARSGVRSRIAVVRHGIGQDFPYSERTKSPSPFVFANTFSAYSFPERKGLPELIEAFQLARREHPDIVLRLRTHPTAEVLDYVRRIDAGNRVEVVPMQWETLHAVSEFIQAASVIVHPSRAEGFGLVALQALACGVPLIAPSHTGLSEFCSEERALVPLVARAVPAVAWDGQGGIQYQVCPQSLSEKMCTAIEDYDVRLSVSENVAGQVVDEFSWENVLHSFAAEMERVCKKAMVLVKSPEPRPLLADVPS